MKTIEQQVSEMTDEQRKYAAMDITLHEQQIFEELCKSGQLDKRLDAKNTNNRIEALKRNPPKP